MAPGQEFGTPDETFKLACHNPAAPSAGKSLKGHFSTLSTAVRTSYAPPSGLAIRVFPAASHHRCQAVCPPAFPLRQALATSRTDLRRDTGQVQGQGGCAQKEGTCVQLQESPDGEAHGVCNAGWCLVFICDVDLPPMLRAELPEVHPARTTPALAMVDL